MSVFKEIFDLDPKEVEEFVKNLTKEKYYFENEEQEKQWWEDFYLEVNWYPTHNNFYVYTEPRLSYESKKKPKYNRFAKKQFPCIKNWNTHYTFKGREITLDEYLWHQFDHHHYNFYEIYGLMTGKTEVWSVCFNCYNEKDDIEFSYKGVYHKEYVNIIKTKSGEWFLQEWESKEDDENEEKRKSLPKDLLDYVVALDPEEVKTR